MKHEQLVSAALLALAALDCAFAAQPVNKAATGPSAAPAVAESPAKPVRAIEFKPLPMRFGDTSRDGEARPFAKDPTVIRHNGRYLMYYSVRGYPKNRCPKGIKPGRWTSAVAESRNLVNWRRLGDVKFTPGKGPSEIVAPCVKKFDGVIHIFGQGAPVPPKKGRRDVIWHGTSEDGLTFTCPENAPMFVPGNTWSIKRAIDAETYRVADRMVLVFATREDPGEKIQQLGMAWAPYGSRYDAKCWTELSKDGPLLKPERPWEMNCLEAATVIRRKGVYYLFYAGAYNHERQQIGVAYSTDGYRYRRLFDEPVFPHGAEGTWNAWESGHPGVFEDDDGRVYLFFQGKATLTGDYALSCAEVLFRD